MTDPQTADDAAERADDASDAADRLLEMHAIRAEHGVRDFDYDDEDVRAVLVDRARLETKLVQMAAELEQVRGERAVDAERVEYATDLLIALARTSPCLQEKGGCITHDRYLPEGSDCPHGLARAFLAGAKAHRRAETTATRPADGSDAEGAGKGPESHTEASVRDARPPA